MDYLPEEGKRLLAKWRKGTMTKDEAKKLISILMHLLNDVGLPLDVADIADYFILLLKKNFRIE